LFTAPRNADYIVADVEHDGCDFNALRGLLLSVGWDFSLLQKSLDETVKTFRQMSGRKVRTPPA